MAVKKPPDTLSFSLFDVTLATEPIPEPTPEVTLEVLPAVISETPLEVIPPKKPKAPKVSVIPRALDLEGAKKRMVAAFETFRYRHQMYDTFRDFCEIASLALSNRCDGYHYDKREARYMEIIKHYNKEELEKFCEILALLSTALTFGPQDVLGQLFHQLELTNKDKGQFFTPQCVADCMGLMSAHGLDEHIKRKGFITLCEPAVGGGSMIFGFCKAMTAQELDYTTQLHVTAIDIDSRCVHMAYVQMALLGIPAIVYHGDALSMEMHEAWFTPEHVSGGWSRKLKKEEEEPAA